MKYKSLFSPIQIGSVMLRNRIIAAPMGIIPSHKIISSTNYGGISAYDRSMGGAGMVHLLDESVDIFSKYELDATREQLNVAKQDGAKVACEVGFFSMVPDQDGYIYGPMDGTRFDGAKMKAFDHETIRKFYDEMVSICLNCKRIGFDAVTIHMGHDSLGSQFLSPVWNQRDDEYGGSVYNRGRFMRDALILMRKALGEGYPIIVRLSRSLKVKETYPEDDMLQFIKSIDGIVDMINISCGMDVYHEANVHAVPTIFEPHYYNAEFAKRIKENTNLQVCLVGAVMNAKEADRLIADGYTDCCMFGRSLVADPYWPKKIMEGHEEDVVPCIRCMHCYHIATDHFNVQCSVNPRFRRENRMCMNTPIKPRKKNVVIVGGGVAGIIAALSAKENGHNVTLFEKENYLGGLLKWASKGPFKEDLNNYWQYLLTQIKKAQIDVRLNTVATKEEISSLKPDRLILATGSKSRELNIEGHEKMIDCLDAIEYMEELPNNLVIIGGGSIGVELALELSLLGKKSTIIEYGSELALNANKLYRIAMYQHLNIDKNITVITNASVNKVGDNYVVLTKENKEIKVDCDQVIFSVGRVKNNDKFSEFYDLCYDTVSVGDCDHVGSIIDAVNLAYFIGKSN